MKVVFSKLFTEFFNGVFRQRFTVAPALFAATFLLSLFGLFHPAMADTATTAGSGSITMGEVFCNVANNLYPFIEVFNMVAYCASGVFVMQGVMHFRNHHEEPRQHPHHKTFALLGAGAILSALPSMAGMLTSTLFAGADDFSTDTGLGACVETSSGTTTGSTAVGLDTMLANFIANIQDPLETLVSVVAITLGVFLIVRGLMKAAKYGNDPRTHSITHILSNLIIGAVLVVIGQTVWVIMGSVFGDQGSSIVTFESLSWTALNNIGGDTTHFKVALKAALTFFQLVGLISFVRGWNVIRNAVEGVGQATFAQGLTHIIGGVLALNIYLFMQMVDATLGTQFVS
jgi:hypothetical protein